MDLLAALEPLAALGAGPVAIAAGVFARISALVFLLPGMGEHAIPVRVRLAGALAIALALTPMVLAAGPAAPGAPAALIATLAAEAFAGAVIGFAIRIAAFALEIAGHIAAQHLSLSQIFGGGLNAAPEPPIATLFLMAGVTLALAAGLHFKAVAALAASYEIMPFGVFPGADEAGAWAAGRAAYAFSAALALALPFVILGFIYNLAIGAANRAMPQLMVAFVGAPAITLAGLVLLALAAPGLLIVWLEMVDLAFAAVLGGAP
ncbi:MAG: flagellar biosynthetic protein FliR [Amphiplicatus sp.]